MRILCMYPSAYMRNSWPLAVQWHKLNERNTQLLKKKDINKYIKRDLAYREWRSTGANQTSSRSSSSAVCTELSWPVEPQQATKRKAPPRPPLSSELLELSQWYVQRSNSSCSSWNGIKWSCIHSLVAQRVKCCMNQTRRVFAKRLLFNLPNVPVNVPSFPWHWWAH